MVARRFAPDDRALALVRKLPLRWSARDIGCQEAEVLRRGWLDGAIECARLLTELTGFEVTTGGGFGGKWPVLVGADAAMAPALPVRARDEGIAGPDGEYRCDQHGIWREAVGAEELFVSLHAPGTAPGQPFDLLWFGDSERYMVRKKCLEIEDLFGLVRVSATRAVLDRLLIRPRRLDEGVVSEVPLAETNRPQAVEARRPAALSGEARWRDAERFLCARADIVGAARVGDVIEAELHDGTRVAFQCDERRDGWSLTLRDGAYLLTEIRLERIDSWLSVAATVADEIDVMAHGMRGRLVFDLRADLLALG